MAMVGPSGLARGHHMQHGAETGEAQLLVDVAQLQLEAAARLQVLEWHLVYVDDRLSHHPTLPSSEIEISFCVSTMNSMGRCCSTSRTKPLTISATASSSLSPRCRQ